MNNSATAIERTPLSWVKSEIDKTLNHAQNALESYADNTNAVQFLQTCGEYLHEVTNILRIVEIQGAIILAEEMEQLVNSENPQASALEILMRAIIQLPDYLDRLQSGARDLPIALMPLINELRSARNETPFTEDQLFFPNLTISPKVATVSAEVSAATVKRARLFFQSGLVAWYRNPEDRDALKRLSQALEQIRSVALNPELAQLWWVSAGLIEALQENSIDLTIARQLLGKLDRQIKRLIDNGETALINESLSALVRQILYYIAKVNSQGGLVNELRDAFQLDDALPSAEDLAAISNSLAGANRAAMASFSIALREDLANLMDALDLFVRRRGERNLNDLKPMVEQVHKIIGTLMIIDQEAACAELNVVATTLNQLIADQNPATFEESLLNLASRLVKVESILATLDKSAQTENFGDGGQVFTTDERHLHQAVMQQALHSLVQAKEAIINFAQDSILKELDAAQAALNEVAGVLKILNLDRPAELAITCARVVKSLRQTQENNQGNLDQVAVAIAALEFYLEEQMQGRMGESFLAQGEMMLADLVNNLKAEDQLITSPNIETLTAAVINIETPEINELIISDDELASDTLPPIDNLAQELQFADLLKEESQIDMLHQELQWDTPDLGIALMLSEPTAISPALPPTEIITNKPDIDPEILAVFIEETNDEMASLDRNLPQLNEALSTAEGFKNRTSAEALRTVRRSFHTLKGSGRMVGATRLGELAWAIENLLNRIIDGTVSVNHNLLHVVEDARSLLPTLVSDFSNGQNHAQGVEEIAAQALRLAHAGPPPAAAAPSQQSAALTTLPETAASSAAAVIETSVISTPELIVTPISETTNEEIVITAPEIPNVDPTLLQLFINETESYLLTLEVALTTMRSTENYMISEAVPRALHTISGTARMAHIDHIGVVSKSLEQYTKQCIAMKLPLEQDKFNFFAEGLTHLRAALNTLIANQPAPDIEQYLNKISLAQIALDNESVQTQTHHNEGAIKLFLEEAMDTLKALEQLTMKWQTQVTEMQLLPAWRPLIKSLGSGAELIGVTAINSLCCAFNDAVDVVIANPALQSGTTAQLFADVIEQLWVMLEYLREYQPITLPDQLCQALANLAQVPLPTISTPSTNAQFKPQAAPDYQAMAAHHTPERSELLMMFLSEAEDLMATLENLLQELSTNPSNIVLIGELRRALHTLKGGARMVGIQVIADLAHALESMINQVVDGQLPATNDLFELLQTANDKFAEMLDQVRENLEVAPATDLRRQIENFMTQKTAPSQPPPVTPQTPERSELLMMFLSEAEDLMVTLENLLQELSLAPTNIVLIGELRRALHTLKGGARMVGIQVIADIAHALESMINQVVDGHLPASTDLFELLQTANDKFAEMLDQARKGLEIPAAVNLRRQIDNFMRQQTLHEEALIPEQFTSKTDSESKDNASLISTSIKQEAAVPAEPPDSTERRAAPRVVQEQVKVAADLLNLLVNHAAEVSITRSRVDQQFSGLRHSLQEMSQTVTRLREQWRRLETETEIQILHHHEGSSNIDLEPLELERYSNLQQLSRSIMESVSDLASLHNLLSVATRDAEILLLQQSRITKELQEGLMRTRMVPFAVIAERLRRIVRQTAKDLNIKAELKLVGADLEIDRSTLDRIVAPLDHMLRNAVNHGIESPEERRALGKPESGLITITLRREGQEILIISSDDGRGLNIAAIRRKAEERGLLARGAHLSDSEIMRYILEPGFSTAIKVTQIAGRGVGMDVVNNEVKLLGGTLLMESELSRSTTFTIRLPLTLAVTKALLINVQGDLFAIPLPTIRAVLQLSYDEVINLYEDAYPTLARGGVVYQFVHAAVLLNAPKLPNRLNPGEKLPVLLFSIGDIYTAMAVDSLLGAREIVIKSVGSQIGKVREISGATILGDGRVVIILDMGALIRKGVGSKGVLLPKANLTESADKVVEKTGITVLVVDDSITVRKVTARLLERHNMTVLTARDGIDAVSLMQKHIPDLILMDIEMPRMDGYELAIYVRGEPRLRDIPIIMITSRTGNKHRERATQIGVNHYLGKPYQESELLEVINRLCPNKYGTTPRLLSQFRAGTAARSSRTLN